MTNLANVAALIYHGLHSLEEHKAKPVNWAGFYVTDPTNDQKLILGPFQGKVACTEIQFGKGVCGAAATTQQTQVVKNVHEFPSHIACDSASNSEIVVPLILPSGVSLAFCFGYILQCRLNNSNDCRNWLASLILIARSSKGLIMMIRSVWKLSPRLLLTAAIGGEPISIHNLV